LVLPFCLRLDLPSGHLYLDVHTKQCAVKNITVFYMYNTIIGQMFTRNGKLMLRFGSDDKFVYAF
jgi:hypothetical protein